MAESEVANNGVSNCFCHQCSVEISPKLPDFTCPRCNSGFIEILEGDREDGERDTDSDGSNDGDSPLREFFRRLNGNGANNPPSTTQGNSDTSNGVAGSSTSAGGLRRSTRFRNTLNPRYGRRRPVLDPRQQSFAPVLQELMMQMTSSVLGPGVGAEVGIFHDGGMELPGFPMLLTSNLASNPGDYAWGRGGLDAIITQLMNQLDGTGPPPLPQEKIEQIPTVKITQEQCDKNLQCTVCMEDYTLGEPVRKLNCGHCYHDDCIIPWLQLHGTCPVCRKTLSSRGQMMNNVPHDDRNVASPRAAPPRSSANDSPNPSSHQPRNPSMSFTEEDLD